MIMDGWHWMVLDDAFPIRQALPVGILGLSFGAGPSGLDFLQKTS